MFVESKGDLVVTKEIALGHGKFAIVDDIDHWFLIQWEWYLHSNGYAVRTEKKKAIYMHRMVLERKLGHDDFEIAEHDNQNPLDNHRENLRSSTKAQMLVIAAQIKTVLQSIRAFLGMNEVKNGKLI